MRKGSVATLVDMACGVLRVVESQAAREGTNAY